MSHQKSESLHFYKYLCQKIGSEKEITARRLAFICSDLQVSNKLFLNISSGSKGEGLDLKGSDTDIMTIFPFFKAFESDKDIKAVKDCCLMYLVMNIEDTQPCFTHLQLYSNYKLLPDELKQTLLKHRGMNVLSSDLYKSYFLSYFNKYSRPHYKIHGPCITDNKDALDSAFCIKCDKWLSIAQPWITRPRSAWPPPELISKITSCGFLNSKNQNTLINILKNAYQTGIQTFSSSQTLNDYTRFSSEITKSVCETTTLIKTIAKHFSYPTEQPSIGRINKTFTTFLHQSYLCRRELSRYILTLLIANTYQRIPSELPHINNPNNKQQYKNYKLELSQWLVGLQSDAVSGWLKLASFFYVHNKYSTSTDIINYTLSKCTHGTYESILSNLTLKQIEKQKLIPLLKTYPIPLLSFSIYSSILPMEIRSDFFEPLITVNYIPFAYFLRFLCSYHLQDTKSCQWHNGLYPMLKTMEAMETNYENGLSEKRVCMQDIILLGIANQMFDYRTSIIAKDLFRNAAEMDQYKYTSAAFRLQQIS
ncbi:unnamed protein product [Mytilus coruscus]|uniref:Uncharacterized protein n=1 Tax=Mytilus coruscus TaxID=42192 RepID=A0A6J8AN03_MYTCO|nr:unnamed protein product [Mytilus coruscus]